VSSEVEQQAASMIFAGASFCVVDEIPDAPMPICRNGLEHESMISETLDASIYRAQS